MRQALKCDMFIGIAKAVTGRIPRYLYAIEDLAGDIRANWLIEKNKIIVYLRQR